MKVDTYSPGFISTVADQPCAIINDRYIQKAEKLLLKASVDLIAGLDMGLLMPKEINSEYRTHSNNQKAKLTQNTISRHLRRVTEKHGIKSEGM